MKTHSTIKSAENGEYTILSIIETIIAITFYAVITVKTGTFKYIAVSTFIAPFLLLRTERSAMLSFELAKKIIMIIHKMEDKILRYYAIDEKGISYNVPVERMGIYALLGAFNLFSTILSLLIIKMIATLVTLIKHPVISLREIRSNWIRVVFCTDMYHPPEILPGIETHGPEFLDRYKFTVFIKEFMAPDQFQSAFRWLIIITLVPIIYLPAFIYRCSLKGTSPIWSPLIWVVRSIRDSNFPLKDRLEYIHNSIHYRLVLYYSIVVIILCMIKLFVLLKLIEISAPVFNEYMLPKEISLWHLAAFVNAILAIQIYYIADKYLILWRSNQIIKERLIDLKIKILTFCRDLLFIYIMTCILYITLTMAIKVNLYQMKVKLFPWH